MALSPRVPELPRPLLIGVARFLASAAPLVPLTAVGIEIESDVTEHTIDLGGKDTTSGLNLTCARWQRRERKEAERSGVRLGLVKQSSGLRA